MAVTAWRTSRCCAIRRKLFGKVASDPIGFRVLDSIHSDALSNISIHSDALSNIAARAAARARAWEAGTMPGEIVIENRWHAHRRAATVTRRRG